MADRRSAESLDEITSLTMTPKTCNRLHIPREVLGTQVRPHLEWRRNSAAESTQECLRIKLRCTAVSRQPEIYIESKNRPDQCQLMDISVNFKDGQPIFYNMYLEKVGLPLFSVTSVAIL